MAFFNFFFFYFILGGGGGGGEWGERGVHLIERICVFWHFTLVGGGERGGGVSLKALIGRSFTA